MSGSPIPQLVNISHALQSSLIQQIRTEIKEFTDAPQLSSEQSEKIDRYISSLESAFAEFTKDNEHIERRDQNVTSADVQLYTGLKTMYADYLSQLIKLRKIKMDTAKELDGIHAIEYIRDELPYKQPNERKQYMQNLMSVESYKIPRSDRLLQGIIDLSVLDSTVLDNLRTYIAFLKFVGYSQSEITAKLPYFNTEQVDQDSKAIVSPPKPEYEVQMKQQEQKGILNTDEESKRAKESLEEPKKKISFSKYLKKGDTNEQNKRPIDTNEDNSIPKRSKLSTGSKSLLTPILKVDNSIKKKKLNSIRFVEDDSLVTIYGDELPPEGLVVSPQKLKKILKPFKDGEPRETRLPSWANQKARELSIPECPDDSDIVETKGGPISCESRVPLMYRLNFTGFCKDLNKPPKDPVVLDETTNDKGLNQKKPVIARAFGKNALLLKKDRGGLPYKRVPEITRNDYPPQPSI
ncbi:LAFE_0H06106g1_1 [Lachancea fermentati]|uniref:LAFE_0H06106g1_1 n=1 Tax=Lachancea fermentati TaxID=4955 RepID=A0A1G4MJQ5_LACFM|nr:LAFE_0H06106g1_1 [Lachancea fermentati]